MKSLCARACLGFLFALALCSSGAVSSQADVTFLGVEGAANTGRSVVGWTIAGVPDSVEDTFGMTPGLVVAGASYESTVDRLIEPNGTSMNVRAHLSVADSGPVGRGVIVAAEYFGLNEWGYVGSPERHAKAALDLVLRYDADQPTIYWAMFASRADDVLPIGPAGEAGVTHPAADLEVPYANGWDHGTAAAGSAPNTGRLEVGAMVQAIRGDGMPANWWYDEGIKIYLSAVPLTDFVAGVAGLAPPSVSFATPYPNPSRGGATLDFTVPATAHATLAIHDIAGRKVRTLVDGEVPASYRSVRWNGRDDRGAKADAGVYFARLTVGREVITRRIVLLP
jgi:hypothetical protein